jgi:hypothetical protein
MEERALILPARSLSGVTMAGRKKTFTCGHSGKGQYCHECARQAAEAQKVAESRRAHMERIASAPIPLHALPAEVAEKARRVIEDLSSGKPYMDFKGKRLTTMGQREVISVPIGRRYRLICRQQSGGLEFVEVISHEVYNNRLASGGWL